MQIPMPWNKPHAYDSDSDYSEPNYSLILHNTYPNFDPETNTYDEFLSTLPQTP